jgi:hypothetical protein
MIETKRQLAVAPVSSENIRKTGDVRQNTRWTNPNPDPLALSEIGDRDFSDYSAFSDLFVSPVHGALPAGALATAGLDQAFQAWVGNNTPFLPVLPISPLQRAYPHL